MGGGTDAPAAPPMVALMVQLALLGVFWWVLALHLLRLLAVPLLSDAHPVDDGARAGMAGALVYLLFPGSPATAHRPLALVFGAAAVALTVSMALRARRRRAFRPHELLLLSGNAAMALMLAGGATLGPPAALITAVCLGAASWPLVRPVLEAPGTGRHRRGAAPEDARPELVKRQRRLLVTAPQIGSVAMTLGMTWLLIQ
ncbi:hypothetical protein G5C51_04070 [Streptomyces sp. A7024]|uniref:DUF5134 domain-containing protein n=1 Tax=Streptomyces coryli TaxID=1128680 RepID=A0A6G4TTE9_9ACTN|nr:hypothetical protein [Streptomyces coryli]NGN63083.1 hypothetical protein [Streptomyces coryli]